MSRIGFTKIKYFPKSGARLYIPENLVKGHFPFEDGELIKITLDTDKKSMHITSPKWWELIDWNTMKEAYDKLPENIKDKIKESRGNTT